MAITFVNSTFLAVGTGSTSWSIPTHSSREGGAAFLVAACFQQNSSVKAITDNAGNSYSSAIRVRNDTVAAAVDLWYATNISSASTRVTVTFSTTSTGGLVVGQFQGVSTGSALITTASSMAATDLSTVHDVPGVTPSQSGQLCFMLGRTLASTIGTVAVSSGYAVLEQHSTFSRSVVAYKFSTVNDATDARWTISSRSRAVTALALFSDTAGAAGFFGGRVSRLSLMGCG